MNDKEKLKQLEEKINDRIDLMGGIEEFNKSEVAHEIIVDWLFELINICLDGK